MIGTSLEKEFEKIWIGAVWRVVGAFYHHKRPPPLPSVYKTDINIVVLKILSFGWWTTVWNHLHPWMLIMNWIFHAKILKILKDARIVWWENNFIFTTVYIVEYFSKWENIFSPLKIWK